RIALRIPLPIPEQAPSKRSLANAHPVLAPQAGNRRSGRRERFQALETSRTVLETDDGALQHPFGKLRLAPEALRHGAHQVNEVSATPQLDSPGNVPDLDFVKVGMTEIECGVRRRLDVQRIAS